MKRNTLHASAHGKHCNVSCPHCEKPFRSNNLTRHLQTHNIRKNCRHYSNSIREDLLFKHELVCQTNVKEQECNRFSGIQ